MKTLVVLTTTPSKEEATRIAQALVESRLAACVQVAGEITSFYRWEGKLEESGEWLMIIKTTRERLAQLTAKIESMHSYSVPEVVALPIEGGSAKYLKWVEEEAAGSGG